MMAVRKDFFTDHPANPAAGNFKDAENVKALLSLAHRMGEGGRRQGQGMNLASVRAVAIQKSRRRQSDKMFSSS